MTVNERFLLCIPVTLDGNWLANALLSNLCIQYYILSSLAAMARPDRLGFSDLDPCRCLIFQVH